MLSIIAAIGQNRELGKNNELLWHLKEDLANFKALTWDKKIVMGANTYRSLPKNLDHREYIVLSKTITSIPKGTVYHDFNKLLEFLKSLDEEVMIIGGSKVYTAFLPYVQRLYLTEIKATKEADAYFPSFDKENYQRKVLKRVKEQNINYEIVLYEKR